MMKALDKKLVRDLWGMKGQFLAIAAVVASGVATFVMSMSTLDSLHMTQAGYYRDNRFAEVFATLKRAPESLKSRMGEVPGIDKVDTRIVAAVNLDVEGFSEPVSGRIVSLPDHGGRALNGLYLRKGRLPEAGKEGEVVISAKFALAHGLRPGDKVGAVINGRRKDLTVVGTALSPEYTYEIGPGAIFPDFKRFGVMWMSRAPLASAYNMEGAFNDVAATLARGADLNEVTERLDSILEPYGGAGVYGRQDQLSHRFLSEELRQLGATATIFPAIFFAVSAFLLNVVVGRLVSVQRDQIAALKAFGYGNLAVGAHYLKLIILVVLIGSAAGIGAGAWFGKKLAGMYMEFYSFPFLNYVLTPRVIALSVLFSCGCAVIGTLHAVRRAASLPPAEALRPEAPADYRETFLERLGLGRMLSQPTRMIFRHLERSPVKTLLSVIGIALSAAILMIGVFQDDALDFIIRTQFGIGQREDLSVTFAEPASVRAKYEISSLRGVEVVESFRAVPVRLKYGNRVYRTVIQGFEAGADLHRALDTDLKPFVLPEDGLVLTDHLAKILGVVPGDILTVETLEGARPKRESPVVSLVSEFVGVSGYMDIKALNRLMREGDVISGVYISVDGRFQDEVHRDIKSMPKVAGTVIHKSAIKSFYETLGETVLYFTFVATILGATISFGVVYNSARIALSERGRELASLRVLGFTRGEISYILLGELSVITLLALLPGLAAGWLLCRYLVSNLQTELYRIPLVIEPDTYAFAVTVVLASAFVSGLIIKRKLDRLDLVAVLKTRE